MSLSSVAKRKNLPKRIEAVLFDYDGVIADTMTDNFMAWKYAFQKFNVRISRNDYYALEGMTPVSIAAHLGKKFTLRKEQYTKILNYKADYYRNHNSFRLYEDVHAVLIALRNMRIRLALVSGAASQRILEMTPSQVLSLFDIIVSADHITKCKPNSQGYRKALDGLGIKPRNAIVVENAPLGIQAAINARVYCVALTTTMPASKLKLANTCLRSITGVERLVRNRHV